MQLQPIDLTEIIAVFMGISIVLIPVIGLTARFAIKPVVEALSRGLESRGQDETVRILEINRCVARPSCPTMTSTTAEEAAAVSETWAGI